MLSTRPSLTGNRAVARGQSVAPRAPRLVAFKPQVQRYVAVKNSIDEDTEPTTVEVEMKVEGMMCDGCSGRIEEALKKMENVKHVSISLETKLASVEVQAPSQIDALHMLPTLMEAVKELGFEAEPHFEYEVPDEVPDEVPAEALEASS